jgi:dCTP deaminase
MAGMGQSFYDYRDQILPDHTKTSVSRRRGDNIQRDLSRVLDARKKLNVWEFEIDPAKGWLLKPGIGYLMHTVERIWTMDYVPVLDGKSSIGRLFLTVHVTAGYGDTGFDGQYTLEVVAQYPTIVYPGMRFGQMRFHTLKGEVTDYKQRGNYTGEASLGPVPSMAYRQFENQVTKPTGINAANLPPADSDSVDAAYGSGYGCHNG